MAPTWPSIIPLGATTSAPASAWATAASAYRSRVASLSTVAARGEHAAVAVVGVLVEAQVGHEHERVADLVAQVAQRHLHDAVGVPGPGARGVLVARARRTGSRPGTPSVGELGHLLAEALAGVLHDAGQRGDRLRLVDALAHEERGDQVVDDEAGLGHQAAQGRRGAQPPGPVLGERPRPDPTHRARRATPAPRSARVTSAREATTRSAAPKSWWADIGPGTATVKSPARRAAVTPMAVSSRPTAADGAAPSAATARR